MTVRFSASGSQSQESTTTAGGGGKRPPRPPFGVSTVSLLAVLIALFSLVPLGYVVYMTAATGWDTAVELIVRPRVGELLLNTIMLMVLTVPLCLVLGVGGGAWLVERTNLRGHRWWAVALAAPLAIPAFVNSYSWVSAVPSLEGIWSGVLIATLSYFPLVYIPAAATLGRLDPAIEQSAASMGFGPWAVFFRVVLPQLRIAMTGGALLVALHLLAEYGALHDPFRYLHYRDHGPVSVDVQRHGRQYVGQRSGVPLPYSVARRGEKPRLGPLRTRRFRRPGQDHPDSSRRLSSAGAAGGLLSLTVLAFGLPVWFVLRWTVAGGPEVWAADEFVPALLQTLMYGGAVGAAVTTVVAFPMAYLAVRHPSWFSKMLELSNYVTSSMPGIVVGLAFVTVSIRAIPGVYQTAGVLIAAYVLLFVPRA